jgi:ADP-heptose:LPS heptosyltransferase
MTQGNSAAGGTTGAVERILVVRAGALGDTLMATPAVRALRRLHPGAEIDFLCTEPAVPLLAANPCIRRVLALPLRERNLPWLLSPAKRRLAREIGRSGYHLVVLLESAPRFHGLLRRAGARHIRSFRDIAFDSGAHSIVNNLRVAGWQGEFRPETMDMDLLVADRDHRAAAGLLEGAEAGRDARPLVGFHAGYGPASRKTANQGQRLKGWDADNFSELGRLLASRGARIVLTGSPEDRAEAERITAGLTAGSFIQLAGRTTVGELAAVIGRMDLFVSVDSGPAHMAAALARPLVVVWGPSRLEQVRPVSSRSPVRVVRHPVFCAPCYDTPMMRSCRRNICMEAISPQRVFREALPLLALTPEGVRA